VLSVSVMMTNKPGPGCRLLPVLGLMLLVVQLLLLHGCSGQADGGSAPAPMPDREKRALFAAVNSFVGKAWNGSGLYPDPCGWSPIQVRACQLLIFQ
jgi:hypothetical protein